MFVEVVDLTSAGRCVTARPDAVGVAGGGGHTGRSSEPSGPPEVDHHPGCVDDHPADLVEQAVGRCFGRVDVVAVFVGQPLPSGLVLWNRLETPACVTNSEVGPAGVIDGGGFVADGVFGGYCALDAFAQLETVEKRECEDFIRAFFTDGMVAMSVITPGKA